MIRINPTGNRVVLKFPEPIPPSKDAPEGTKSKVPTVTEVLEVGPDVKKVKSKDIVLYEDFGFFEVEVYGARFLIGNESNIQGYPTYEGPSGVSAKL